MYDYSVFFTDVINGRDNNLLKIAQFKMPAYVNYLYDSSGVTVLTNGLPNYVPTMFGERANTIQEVVWNSVYKNTNLSRDNNPNKLKFNYVRYRFNIPDMSLKDARQMGDVFEYGHLAPMGSIGVAINGVSLYNSLSQPSVGIQYPTSLKISSGVWNNNSITDDQTKLDSWIRIGRNVYYLDAISGGEQFSTCCGHNSEYQYHYHKLPYCESGTNALHPDPSAILNMKDVHSFYDNKNKNNEHSRIIGWLIDGYPVYGPIGYKYYYENNRTSVYVVENDLGEKQTVFKRSSYEYVDILRDASGIPQKKLVGQQNIRYSGYKFVKSNIEDDSHGIYLDHCNGIFGPTPEFPDGIYHYHTTIDIDFSGNPKKGLDYYYPYDIDNMIIFDEDSAEDAKIIRYINIEVWGISFVISDDFNLSWYDWLSVIYNPSNSSAFRNRSGSQYENTYIKHGFGSSGWSDVSGGKVKVSPPNQSDITYYSYNEWDAANEVGGLIAFWLNDQGNIGYNKLISLFPNKFDVFESIIPVFPFITNMIRGNVDISENGVSTGNEVKILHSNSPQHLKNEWVNAANQYLTTNT